MEKKTTTRAVKPLMEIFTVSFQVLPRRCIPVPLILGEKFGLKTSSEDVTLLNEVEHNLELALYKILPPYSLSYLCSLTIVEKIGFKALTRFVFLRQKKSRPCICGMFVAV